MSGEGVEFKWTRKRHDIRQAAKRFLEGDEAMNDPAAEENEEDQNYTAECFVSRDAIARSKDDEIARHRDRLHDKVGAAVAERIAGKGSHLVAIVDTAWPDNDLRALGLRTKAYITDIPGAIEQRQRLKDTEAALAAAAEQLRAVMEANEKLQAENKKLNKIRFKLDGINTANKTLAWRLVDLFDRNVRGVSPLHYVEEQIKELQAENERLNEIIASYSMASILNRKQLSQANQDAGRWQGQAETWQQRAEISEAQLIRIGADRE